MNEVGPDHAYNSLLTYYQLEAEEQTIIEDISNLSHLKKFMSVES